MTYYPQHDGGAGLYHDHWSETPHGANSRNGPRLAFTHGKTRIDIDAVRSRDFILVNDHGAPLHVYCSPKRPISTFTWSELSTRVYVHGAQTFHLRTIAQALKENAAQRVKGRPLGSEVEIKNIHPVSPAQLNALMLRLAADARAAYGADWQRHVTVKVVVGSLAYQLEICKAAHAAGIPTLISVRGKARFLAFAGHVEVTRVRGSLNPMIRRKH